MLILEINYMEQINWGIGNGHENQYATQDDGGGSSKRYRCEIDGSSVKKHKCEFINPLIYTIGNEMHFSADINKINIEFLIKKISKMIDKFYSDHDSNEPYTIIYIVDTPGGSVNSVLKFVDHIKLTKIKYPNLKFTSIISGLVASAGTIMCIVADNRYITKNSHAMIHELSSENMGKFTQLMSYTNFLKELHDCMLNIYAERTSKNKTELAQLLKNETWYNAQQYLDGGFVDGIK
jgi:Protease subunit of ATP-dependent Clp proteases